MKKFLMLYRNRSGHGQLWPTIRDEGDFQIHDSYVYVRKYELFDDGSLVEVELP